MIRTVYIDSGADAASLTRPMGDDAAELRAHLLDQLIPALIRSRPPSADPAEHFRPRRRLDPVATRRYLSYLAHAFPPTTTRDIAWWHIASTTPHLKTAATLVGVVAGLASIPVFGLRSGLMLGLLGLVVGHGATTAWADETPGYADLRLRGRTRLLLISIKGKVWAGLGTGLAPGAGAVVVEVFDSGLGETVVDALLGALAIGLLAGLPAALAFGLLTWAEQPRLTSTSTPRSTRQADKVLTLLRMIVPGFLCGLVVGLVAVPGVGLSDGLVVGLWIGLMAGAASVLMLGKHHAWLISTIAVARLALARRLPLRIMDFLDDAHKLGLLRTVGPVYQFRHAALHDHLAATPPP